MSSKNHDHRVLKEQTEQKTMKTWNMVWWLSITQTIKEHNIKLSKTNKELEKLSTKQLEHLNTAVFRFLRERVLVKPVYLGKSFNIYLYCLKCCSTTPNHNDARNGFCPNCKTLKYDEYVLIQCQ